MIVQPNFLDHWKTNALGAAIGRLEAITALLSLWGHCQNQRTWQFPNNELMIAGICRYTGNPRVLVDTLLQLNLLENIDENTLEVHEWAETNAKLLHNWEAGKKGGRPSKQPKDKPTENPRVNPSQTQGEPQGEPIREDKIREENTPLIPQGGESESDASLHLDESQILELQHAKSEATASPQKKERGRGSHAQIAQQIYDLYPRKVGKTAALRAIERVLKAGRIPAEDLIVCTQNYATATARWAPEDREYIPNPATWFNQGRYEDDPREWQRKANGTAQPTSRFTTPDSAREDATSRAITATPGGSGPAGWQAAMDHLEGPGWHIGITGWLDLTGPQRQRVIQHLTPTLP
jgi:hypothetical protein